MNIEAYTNMQYGMTKENDNVEIVVDHSDYISCTNCFSTIDKQFKNLTYINS